MQAGAARLAKGVGHLVSLTASAQGCLGLFRCYNTNTPLINQLLTLSCNTSALTLHPLFLWPCYCSPKRLQIPKEFWLCSVTPAKGFPLCPKVSLESGLWEEVSHPGTQGVFAHSKLNYFRRSEHPLLLTHLSDWPLPHSLAAAAWLLQKPSLSQETELGNAVCLSHCVLLPVSFPTQTHLHQKQPTSTLPTASG